MSRPAGTRTIPGVDDPGVAATWDLLTTTDIEQTSPGLASQLASVQKLFGVSPDLSPLYKASSAPVKDFMLELKSISELHRGVTAYFKEANGLFPIFDKVKSVDRIYKLLGIDKNSEVVQVLRVDLETYPSTALLCILLATSQLFSRDSQAHQEPHSGWTWYLQAQNLHQHFSQLNTSNLDILGSHVLSAYYLMMCGCFSHAFRAITLATRLAMELRLNVQDTWLPRRLDEVLHRERLWWGLYVLDQKISQYCGLAYSIREHEVAVDNFIKPCELSETSNQTDDLRSDVPTDLEYFQALVSLARTGRVVWDRFCSATAPREADHVDIARLDSQILHCASRLSQSLTWKSERLQDYLTQGESGMSLWRRMILFNVREISP